MSSDLAVSQFNTQSVGFLEILLMYFHGLTSGVKIVKANTQYKSLPLQVDRVIETYWKTVPAEIENILEMPVVINLICLCDVITYRNILAILVPRPSECMPDR